MGRGIRLALGVASWRAALASRLLVTDIYRRRCTVTQECTLPALEAAPIHPNADGGEHEIWNGLFGLFLRRDMHCLY